MPNSLRLWEAPAVGIRHLTATTKNHRLTVPDAGGARVTSLRFPGLQEQTTG